MPDSPAVVLLHIKLERECSFLLRMIKLKHKINPTEACAALHGLMILLKTD